MKKILHTTKIILLNFIVIIILLLVIDFFLTKFDLIALKVKIQGAKEYGYSQIPIDFKDSTKKDSITIVVIGDSHLQYNKNDGEHNQCFVLYRYLADHNIPARVILLGTARTSPIQQMIMYSELIKKKNIKADYIIFQLYAGNDYSEILRSDDRPRVDFKPDGTPYIIPINWVLERPISDDKSFVTKWPRDSRLLYLTNAAVGHENIILKLVAVKYSNELLHFSLSDHLEYIKNLNRFRDSRLGYSGAIASQFLNQYYLMDKYSEHFYHESSLRMKYFLEYFKKENPDAVCIISNVPSAPAIDAMDNTNQTIYKEILKRSNLSEINITGMEKKLYQITDSLNIVLNKPFIIHDLTDTLRRVNKQDGTQTLYDKPTIHVGVLARKVIGEYWGAEIIRLMNNNPK